MTITEFSNWNPDTICEVTFKTQRSDLGLPEALEALVTSVPEDADAEQTGNVTTEPNTIKVPVQWNCDHYDGTVLGDYVFQASPVGNVLAEQNLSLKDGVLFPTATVRVVSAGPVVLESDLGVTVTADNEEIVDPDTSLNVEKSQVADEVLQELAEKEENISYDNMIYQNLDISLEMDGEQVQPEGQVEVSMEIPEGMAEENFAVYHLAEDGTLTKMEGRVEDGKYIFQTTHFSDYLGVSTLNTSGPVTTYNELTAAISAANPGDTITIQGEIPLSSQLSISKKLTLTGGTIYRSSDSGKISIYGDVTLEGIIIDGKGISSSLNLIQVFPGGNLVIENGTFIQNQMSTGNGRSAIYVGDDTESGNAACVMKDGSIVNNTSAAQGAGVLVKSNGTFHMQGGVISGNRTTDDSNNYSGAGVYNLGSLYLEGGRISDNHAAGWGGGIYNTSYAKTFAMTGGIIESSNTATKGSGVFHSAQNQAGAEFHISGNAQVNAEIYLDYNSSTADKFAYLDGPLNYTITIKPLNYTEGKVIAKVSDAITDAATINNILNQSIKKITVPVVVSGSTTSVWYTYLDGTSIKITQQKPDYIKDQVYVDGQNGSDSTGDGTKDNPVQSFDKAKDYLDHNGTIIVKDPIIVDNDQTWELPSDVYGDDSKVVIDTGSGEPGVVVKPGGTLNLGDITIQNPGGDTVIVVEGGTLNTSPDTTLTGKDGTGVVEHVLDVTAKLSNITHNGPSYVNSGEAYSTTLTPEAGYELPDTITVVMGTELEAGTGYTYDKTSGVVSITSVTASVTITASGNPIPVMLTAVPNTISGKVLKAITPVELQVTGGSGTAELSITAGTLPAGLTLENGRIAGTPTETGTGTVTVQAADANGTTATVQISVDIQPYHGEITGKVADVNGLPLNGVQVTLKDGSDQTIGSTVTNADGDYKISDLPDGSYTLTVQKDTVSKNSSIGISNDGANVTGDRNFKLPVGGADLTGTVTDVNSQAVAGAEVILKTAPDTEVGRSATDGQGKYTFANVPDGTYEITVSKNGKTDTFEVIISNNGQTAGMKDVQLLIGGADLTGIVTDVNKLPVEGAAVVVSRKPDSEAGRFTTDSSGSYTITNLPDGEYVITAEKDGTTGTANVTVSANGQNVSGTGNVQLPYGGADLSGKVIDINDQAVPGAEVVLKTKAGAEIGRSVTDAQGDYTFAHIPDGAYVITIEKNGAADTFEVGISGNGLTVTGMKDVQLPLGGATLTGTVTDVNARPAKGVLVVITDSLEKEIGRSTTDDQGNYTIGNIPDAAYKITFEKDGITGTGNVTISGNGQSVIGDMNMQLPVGGADLTGTVTDVNKQPVKDAEVILKVKPDTEAGRVTTNAHGSYTFANVPDGTYEITIGNQGTTDQFEVVVSAYGHTVTGMKDVQLPIGGAELSGKITDVNNNAVVGAEVIVKDGSGNEIGRDTTDGNGSYMIPNVPDGTHTITVVKDGTTETETIEISQNGQTVTGGGNIQILFGGANVTGTITDVNKQPVEGAEVVIKDSEGNELGRDTTDSNGDYTIPNVPDGNHDITIEKDGKTETGKVEIKDNGKDVSGAGDVQLPVGGADLTGTITDVNKQPVEGAQVVVKDETGKEIGRDTTDSNGDYTIPNVPDGKYDVTVESDGKTETGKVEITGNGQNVSGTDDVQLPVGGADLTGKVTDVNGNPVEGAEVVVKDNTGKELGHDTTDVNGDYTVPNVPDGTHEITIEKDGKTETDQVEIGNNGQTVTGGGDAQLQVGGADVTGTITDVNGKPVEGAEVVVKDETGKELGRDTTDGNGDYTIPNVPDGTHDVTIEKDGKTETGKVEITGNGQNVSGTDDVQLPVGGADVGGNVTDVNGKPVVGAEVVIKDQDGKELGKDTTDANGDYQIPNVPDGSHTITVEKDGKTETGSVDIAGGGQNVDGDKNAQIQVGGASVEGTITDKDGNPISDAEVTVKDENGKELGKDKTDQNGHYEITNIPDGEHSLTVDKDGKANTSDLKVEGEKVTEVNGQKGEKPDISTNLGAEISGTLTNDQNDPVSGAQITAKDDKGTTLDTDVTDENGRYHIENLPDGTITVTITHPKYPEHSIQVAVNGGKTDLTDGLHIQKDAQVKAAEDAIRALIDPNTSSEAQISAAKSQIAQAKELYDVLGGKQSQVEDELIRKLDQLIRKAASLEVNLDIKTAGTQVTLLENPEDLIGLVVSSEELNNSKSIQLVVTVTAIAADAAEKQQIQQAAGGRTVGSYFDISLIKNITWQDGSQESLLVSNVPREIVFTITIPEGMRGGKDYAVVRYHDGVAEVLHTTQIGDTLRFSSDKYSTYAIIYTPIEKHDVPDTKHNNDSQGSSSDSQVSAAQTGDQTPIGLMMMLSLAGLFGIATIFTRKKIVNRK